MRFWEPTEEQLRLVRALTRRRDRDRLAHVAKGVKSGGAVRPRRVGGAGDRAGKNLEYRVQTFLVLKDGALVPETAQFRVEGRLGLPRGALKNHVPQFMSKFKNTDGITEIVGVGETETGSRAELHALTPDAGAIFERVYGRKPVLE